MQIVVGTEKRQTEAERLRSYRARKGDSYRTANARRMKDKRAAALPEFIGVDSEGIGQGKNHRAVLIGCGDAQYIAADLKAGLQWEETFDFLYRCFERRPKAAYVGFFLGYDFNQWLRSLPLHASRYLLSPAGIIARRPKSKDRAYRLFPVREGEWEFDMLGFKRLSIRRRACKCVKSCEHQANPWMHICDAGPFFQDAFKNVIDPKNWDKPVCTQDEWDTIFAGKERRATAHLDETMQRYNVLENQLLSRLMSRLAQGFMDVGVKLQRSQWYGPGAAANQWLVNNGILKREKVEEIIPEWFLEWCQNSYYGGWFEVFSHGVIRGETWNYDINSAYPAATARLPHLCDKCGYRRGKGNYNGTGNYVLLHATVRTKGNRIGAVPYRDKTGGILRPHIAMGTYWRHEIDAANSAGIVDKITVHEWAEFTPCEHPAPLEIIGRLYNQRLEVGKNTAQGKAIKLLINSIYGKFAQSVGGKPFGNWLYASLITSSCRTQILESIATHPGTSESVLMVATDGICFDTRHPRLNISATELGAWDETKYIDLCLFKPGVYWHKEGKENLLKIKSRGVPKREFATGIQRMEDMFNAMLDEKKLFPGQWIWGYLEKEGLEEFELTGRQGWPHFMVPVSFRMKSCKQAINEGKWSKAGEVLESMEILQSSDPERKRKDAQYNPEKRRIDSFIHELPRKEWETKYYGEVKIKIPDIGFSIGGSPLEGVKEIVEVIKNKPMDNSWMYDGEDLQWEQVL